MASKRWWRDVDGRDLVAVAGVGSVLYGVQQWSGPAAWVLFGAALLIVWVRPHVRRG